MSARSSNDSSWGRRKSNLFALSNLRSSSSSDHSDAPAKTYHQTLKKGSKSTRRKSSFHLHLDDHSTYPHGGSLEQLPELAKERPRRPSISMKSVMPYPSSQSSQSADTRASWDELSSDAYGAPLSTSSSKASSFVSMGGNGVDVSPPARTVLLHGEVQTSATLFKKKREYLVLTDSLLIRFKSQAKAADVFMSIPHSVGRSPTIRHGSMQSIGSFSDLTTVSDSSGDKDGRIPLRQVVAVHRLDDGKPYFALEICYLDEESSQASAMALQFGNSEERDLWLGHLRTAVRDVRLRTQTYISPHNLENAARVVERDNDYDPDNCAIYKIVQRQPAAKSGGRSSSDDITKVASTVCFLAIGIHKLHLIQLVKPGARTASPTIASVNDAQASYGILTLSAMRVGTVDDEFEITFRRPLQKPRTLYLASSASYEIAARLYTVENFLRPECCQRLYKLSAPAEVEELLPPPADPEFEEHSCLDRTLSAYCIAYGVNPTNVRYTINYACEDAPRFELLAPADPRRSHYGSLDLLAIMRALRCNESFGGISFAGVNLDSLNGLHDPYGHEMVCTRTKRGTPIRLTPEQLSKSSLLVQEVRALAATSKKLRLMDFSGCITRQHDVPVSTDEDAPGVKDIGCGIVEALFPLCKHQTTNVDWVCLNGIELSETDLDYLVGAAVDKLCHFRAIELNRCGLSDRSLGLILDALRYQENTLESLEIAGNAARLNPNAFDSQLGVFGFIRRLNLSSVAVTSGAEPLLQAETLSTWRLQELRFSGTTLNDTTVDTISTYLAHPNSSGLRQLCVDNTYINGQDVVTLLQSLAREDGQVREMHLDVSQCILAKDGDMVAQAIAKDQTPTQLSMRAIEYRDEAMFRKIISAFTSNKTTRFLDISQTGLPGDAGDETCRALEKFLAENDTIVELDLSGDDSRLAASKFGPGINTALLGLGQNKSMQVFRVEKQKLGIQGASALAEVLGKNKALLELHCENNEIPLHGLTDLVNSLINNTTLLYLPTMDDGRAAAFKAAEATMKVMADLESPNSSNNSKASAIYGASAVKRGFNSVRRTAHRSNAPSFPALSHNRSTPSPDRRTGSPISLTLPTPKARQHPPSVLKSSPILSPASSFTVQDIQTTHRLLTEQWDRQCFRLSQYLHRNWCLSSDVPCEMQIEDEKFERPASVGSLGKMLEQVKYDTTPRAERDVYFDDDSAAPPAAAPFLADLTARASPSSISATLAPAPATSTTTSAKKFVSTSPTARDAGAGASAGVSLQENDLKHQISFKQFLLDSRPPSSPPLAPSDPRATSVGGAAGGVVGSGDVQDEPGTPTQKHFPR